MIPDKSKKLMLALLLGIILTACISLVEQEIRLDGTRWKLQYLEDQELLANTAILMKFSENEITGSAGCNAFGGKYITQSRGLFDIQEITRTMEACIDPEGIMEQEEHFMHILGIVTSYRFEDQELLFLDKDGNVLMQYERILEF